MTETNKNDENLSIDTVALSENIKEPSIWVNFFLKVIIKEAEITDSNKKINGFKNIEIELNKKWWRDKRWNLIITNGLFKHLRVDDRGY